MSTTAPLPSESKMPTSPTLVTAPHRWRNLGDLVDRSRSLDVPAVIDLTDPAHPKEYTHARFDRLVNGVAAMLSARGYERGTHIAIASLNRAEFLLAYFGIMRAGFVAVPINIKQSQEIIDYVIDDAAIKLAFVDQARRASFERLIPVIDFDSPTDDGFDALVHEADFDTVPMLEGGLAQMLYTSGSTGRPKGVPLTHAGQLWALSSSFVAPPTGHQERQLVAQPLFHMNGLFMAKRLFAGNHLLVILPAFETERYADALSRYRITAVTAVPTMFARLIRDPQTLAGKDFSALKKIALASAPMTIGLLDRIQAAFPGALIAHGYGTTEAGPAVFGPHPQGLPTPPLGLGYPVASAEVKLVEGADDDHGVLMMRNPAVMQGYHKLPAKNAQVLNDGWYYSGDVMHRDANGFFFFVGRADDMFVCSGENIYPGEVEKLLESHPAVRQACVVPLADEERAAVPVAFVVLQPGSDLNVAALKQYAIAQGPAYQHPRRVEFLHDLPWAGTNKVDRNALQKKAATNETQGGWSEDTTPAREGQ